MRRARAKAVRAASRATAERALFVDSVLKWLQSKMQCSEFLSCQVSVKNLASFKGCLDYLLHPPLGPATPITKGCGVTATPVGNQRADPQSHHSVGAGVKRGQITRPKVTLHVQSNNTATRPTIRGGRTAPWQANVPTALKREK